MRHFLSKAILAVSIAAFSFGFSQSSIAGGDTKWKAPSWSGLYAGAHLGYGFVDHGADFGDDFDTGPIPIPIFNTIQFIFDADNNADGPLGGIHLGYNIQRGRFVFGIEGDFSKTTSDVGAELRTIFTDNALVCCFEFIEQGTIDATVGFKVQMDYLASLRARAGWASDKFLVYLTGGVAWTKLEAKLNINVEGTGVYDGSASASFDLGDETLTGFVIGGGGEYKLADGMSIRGEVLHYEFDDKDIEFDTTVIRAGLSVQLN